MAGAQSFSGVPSASQISNALAKIADADALEEATATVAAAAEKDPAQLERILVAFRAQGGPYPALTPVHDAWMSTVLVGPQGVVGADPAFRDVLQSPRAGVLLRESIARLRVRLGGERRAFARLALGDGRAPMAVAAPAALARNWPVTPDLAAMVAKAPPGSMVVTAFSPQAIRGFAELLRLAFGLSNGEGALAATLFDAPTLAEACRRLSLSVDTVKKRMRGLLRKTGAAHRSALATRFTELVAGDHVRVRDRPALLREAFGLTKAESLVAEAIAEGHGVPAIAGLRGVSQHTVRAQIEAIREKTSATKAPDLARMLAELSVLATWTSCSEAHRQDRGLLMAATRVVVRPGGRRIIAADYGPSHGTPVLYLHPGFCYRWIRSALRYALIARGMRPISFDRAGSGLSDSWPAEGHPFDVAAQDALAVMKMLKIERVRLFSEFNGVAAALSLAKLCPDLIEEAVLLMPRPQRQGAVYPGAIARLQESLSDKPSLFERLYDAALMSGGTSFWRWIQNRISQETPADRAAMSNEAFVAERVGEMNASLARGSRGDAIWERAHQSEYPRFSSGGLRWTIVETAIQPFKGGDSIRSQFEWLPGVRFVKLEDAGRLATHTHAEALADLFV